MKIEQVVVKVHEICAKGGAICVVPVKENGRLSKCLGRVMYDADGITPTAIEFSRNYLAKATEADIMETIIHECAHYVVTVKCGERHGHDAIFKAMYKKLGGSNVAEGPGHSVSWADASTAFKYSCYCANCNKFLAGAATSRTNWVKYSANSKSTCCNSPIKVVQNW